MRPRSKAGTIVRFSVCFVLLFLGALLFAASFWCQRHFGFVPLDQLIFTFKSPMEGANTDEVVTSFLVECLPVSLAAAVILVLLAVNWVQPQKTVTLWLFHKPRTFGVFPFLLYRKLLPLLSVAALVAGIGYGAYTLYIPEFIESQLTPVDLVRRGVCRSPEHHPYLPGGKTQPSLYLSGIDGEHLLVQGAGRESGRKSSPQSVGAGAG